MHRYDLVSIIVPALNEARSFNELYERTHKALEDAQRFEFIVIDDGSTDDTVEVLRALRARYPNVCVLSHYRNHGKSLALMQGFSIASGEVAVRLTGTGSVIVGTAPAGTFGSTRATR